MSAPVLVISLFIPYLNVVAIPHQVCIERIARLAVHEELRCSLWPIAEFKDALAGETLAPDLEKSAKPDIVFPYHSGDLQMHNGQVFVGVDRLVHNPDAHVFRNLVGLPLDADRELRVPVDFASADHGTSGRSSPRGRPREPVTHPQDERYRPQHEGASEELLSAYRTLSPDLNSLAFALAPFILTRRLGLPA